MLDTNPLFPPPSDLKTSAHITAEKYKELYKRSVQDPEGFWKDVGSRITWFRQPTIIKNTSFDMPVSIKWYEDGILNASYNLKIANMRQFQVFGSVNNLFDKSPPWTAGYVSGASPSYNDVLGRAYRMGVRMRF